MRTMDDPTIEGLGDAQRGFDRRRFLTVCSAAGVANTLLPGALLALASQDAAGQTGSAAGRPAAAEITPEMIDAAAAIAGITVTSEQKSLMLSGLKSQRESAAVIRELHLPNNVAPAFIFDPVPPGMVLHTAK